VHQESPGFWLPIPSKKANLTPLFSCAERTASNLIARKMLENGAIEASRCNSLLAPAATCLLPLRHLR
jgi:hypothetical protein